MDDSPSLIDALFESSTARRIDPRTDAGAAVIPWNQNSSSGWVVQGTPSGYNTPIAAPSQWSR